MSILKHLTGKTECRSVKLVAMLAGVSIPTAQAMLNKAMDNGLVDRRKIRAGAPRAVWGYHLTVLGSTFKGNAASVVALAKRRYLTQPKKVWHDLLAH